MEKHKFKNKKGIAKIDSDLRIRAAPSTKNNVPLYEILSNPAKYQNVLNFVGWVENGENIRGNPKWYKDGNGHYFWSGNVADLKEANQKSSKSDSILTLIKREPNPGTSQNAKNIRKIIDYEFRFDTPYEKTDLQCTEYVQFRVLQKLGHKINWGKHTSGRHGGRWWSILKKNGYTVLDSPQADCAVCLTRVYKTDGTLTKTGHIAFIERVGANNTIHVSEANWPSKKGEGICGQFNKRPISKDRWESHYMAKFIKFV